MKFFKKKCKLYLIPSPITEKIKKNNFFPKEIKNIIKKLNFFFVENEKKTRNFIKYICPTKSQLNINFFILKNYKIYELEKIFINIISKGESIGLLSESGLPCIADPGREIVFFAHKINIRVIPLVGPSSIFLALISSGLNGQNFSFHGYLPIEKKKLKKKIKEIENISFLKKETQIFMETPYRNKKLLKIIFSTCSSYTLLTIATNITSSYEKIKTKYILDWKKKIPSISKKPTIFILSSQLYKTY